MTPQVAWPLRWVLLESFEAGAERMPGLSREDGLLAMDAYRAVAAWAKACGINVHAFRQCMSRAVVSAPHLAGCAPPSARAEAVTGLAGSATP